MAAEQSETPWDDFLSDFTLILDSGERIKCHKKALGNASPVLRLMLTTDMKEAHTNEMTLKGHGLKTVFAFLRYIYAEQNHIEELKMEKQDGEPASKSLVVEEGFRIKDFAASIEIYPPLMRLAHMYQVEDLVGLCVDHLKQFKPERLIACTLTAKDIYRLAVDLGNKDLLQCSSVWLASDAFETLKCGAIKCNKETKKPKVLLKCGDCGRLTDVSSHQPNVLDEDGNKISQDELDELDESMEDSQVSVVLP